MSQNISRWQAVLFDLDGTLLDTAPDFVSSTKQLLEQHGKKDVSDELIRNAVSDGSMGIIEKTFQLNPDEPEAEALRLALIEIYFQRLHEATRPFPGVIETLSALQEANIPWGIVTNKPSRFTDAILERLPFTYAPQTVICPDHVSQTKPHPEPILLACRELGINPEHTAYAGDHIRDIEAGNAAGCSTIAAHYGYISTDENTQAWQADYAVQNAHEFLPLIFG